jgi:hypothetical protein
MGEWLVRNGLALDWPQYSKGRYAAAEREADRSGRGMWAGSYVEPWFVAASRRAALRPAVRMIQTHILERAFKRRLGASTVENVGVSWCDLCDSR